MNAKERASAQSSGTLSTPVVGRITTGLLRALAKDTSQVSSSNAFQRAGFSGPVLDTLNKISEDYHKAQISAEDMNGSAMAMIKLLRQLEALGLLEDKASQERVLIAVARDNYSRTMNNPKAGEILTRSANLGLKFMQSPESDKVSERAEAIIGKEALAKLPDSSSFTRVLDKDPNADFIDSMIGSVVPLQIFVLNLMREKSLSDEDAAIVYQSSPLLMSKPVAKPANDASTPVRDINAQLLKQAV